jgi:tyrosyl-tRNA synthetase
MPEVTLHSGGKGLALPQVCKQAGLTASTSEAMRLIEQRGLKVDGEVAADKTRVVAAGTTAVIQAGKRKFARVTIT